MYTYLSSIRSTHPSIEKTKKANRNSNPHGSLSPCRVPPSPCLLSYSHSHKLERYNTVLSLSLHAILMHGISSQLISFHLTPLLFHNKIHTSHPVPFLQEDPTVHNAVATTQSSILRHSPSTCTQAANKGKHKSR